MDLHWWSPHVDKLLGGLTTIILAAVGAVVNKQLGVGNAQRANATLVDGYLGIAAKEMPGTPVQDVLDGIQDKMVTVHNMSEDDARIAVAAAQVKAGLPTGPDAKTTLINDVWTGTRQVPPS